MHLALKVTDLTVHYDAIPVLWDINLEVPCGKFVGILGPNGAGKSTFIQALLGFIPKVSGNILFSGHHLSKIQRKLAYMPQRASIDWDFPITVKELVAMGRFNRLGLFKRAQEHDKKVCRDALELVELLPFADRQISKLSGGQQQRLFLARAIAQEADIYFLDEPLSGVDHASEDIIMNILRTMQLQNKTIFMVHHDLNTAAKFFDWAILLNLRLVASGPMGKVFVPHLLQEAYGKSLLLYDEVARLAEKRAALPQKGTL